MNLKKHALSIDLGGTSVRIGVVNASGDLLLKKTCSTDADLGAGQIIENIYKLADDVIVKYPDYETVGMGSPGCIDSKQGKVLFATDNLPGWRGTELKKILEVKFRKPVYVQNDVNMMTFAESRIGSGKGYNDFICLTLGTGVGGGIVVNGFLYEGDQYYAGEMGHITINFSGPYCNCGGQGCLEAYIGTKALVSRVEAVLLKKEPTVMNDLIQRNNGMIRPYLICQAAEMGDKAAMNILMDMGLYLGIGLGNIINAFSPQRIAIGGGIAQSWKWFYPSMMEAVHRQVLFGNERNISIVAADLGPDAGLIGAGLYALEQEEKHEK